MLHSQNERIVLQLQTTPIWLGLDSKSLSTPVVGRGVSSVTGVGGLVLVLVDNSVPIYE